MQWQDAKQTKTESEGVRKTVREGKQRRWKATQEDIKVKLED